MSSIKIRTLQLTDIKNILEIEAKVSNPARPIFDIDLELTAKWAIPFGFSVCAEVGDKLVGFILGYIKGSEFGVKSKIGWLSVIAVDPDYQGQKIGITLGQELMKRFKAAGATRAQSMLRWNHGDLINYFDALEFEKSPMIVVERNL